MIMLNEVRFLCRSALLKSTLRAIHRSQSEERVRVRFAPSPTGYLHLGGLRTALYNYLFARSQGGSFILRIEDTDEARRVEGAVDALEDALAWVGLAPDEGPRVGGPHAPYVQSQRLPLYRKYAEKLVSSGAAYRCWCTERRLALVRREALRARLTPRYDNHCRHLTKDEEQRKLDSGAPYVIRFKLTSEVQWFPDLVLGNVAYDVALAEGDPVLLKSDGWPTYHLANVVDDHSMRITHVLRGVEWQLSTTKHIMLYRALGWTAPQFGHLPLLLNPDGSKLSKRQDHMRLQHYRDQGIFPLALCNYVAQCGGGLPHEPGAGLALHALPDLVQLFSLDRVSRHPSRLNPELMEEFNRLELRERVQDPEAARLLARDLHDLVLHTFKDESDVLCSEEHVRRVVEWAGRARVWRLGALLEPEWRWLWKAPSLPVSADLAPLLSALEQLLQQVKCWEEDVHGVVGALSEAAGVSRGLAARGARAALAGRGQGPPVHELLLLLGRGEALARVRRALQSTANQPPAANQPAVHA